MIRADHFFKIRNCKCNFVCLFKMLYEQIRKEHTFDILFVCLFLKTIKFPFQNYHYFSILSITLDNFKSLSQETSIRFISINVINTLSNTMYGAC